MPLYENDDEEEEELVELDLVCHQCDPTIEYTVYTKLGGFLEEARYCPFCGSYNLDYDNEEENDDNGGDDY